MEPCDTCRRNRQRWADDNDISGEPGDKRIIVTKLGALEMCRAMECECDCHAHNDWSKHRDDASAN
jgi:hypothetical protein